VGNRPSAASLVMKVRSGLSPPMPMSPNVADSVADRTTPGVQGMGLRPEAPREAGLRLSRGQEAESPTFSHQGKDADSQRTLPKGEAMDECTPDCRSEWPWADRFYVGCLSRGGAPCHLGLASIPPLVTCPDAAVRLQRTENPIFSGRDGSDGRDRGADDGPFAAPISGVTTARLHGPRGIRRRGALSGNRRDD
jgi:hypothetical protein